MLGKAQGWIGKAIERWRLFWSLDAGHRFQASYHSCRFRRECGEAYRYGRVFNLIVGPLLVVAHFLFLPTPGPSYIIIVIGMWMLASELLILARFFDRAEVRLRKLGGWIKSRWSRWPVAVKVLVVSVCAAAFVYGAYSLLFGG